MCLLKYVYVDIYFSDYIFIVIWKLFRFKIGEIVLIKNMLVGVKVM